MQVIIVGNVKPSFQNQNTLVDKGVSKAQAELSRPGSTLDTNAKTYSINDPVDAVALSYYHAIKSNVAMSAMFAKRAIELCGTVVGEVEALVELSINSSTKTTSSIFRNAAYEVDSIARKEFFEKMRRTEWTFPTD